MIDLLLLVKIYTHTLLQYTIKIKRMWLKRQFDGSICVMKEVKKLFTIKEQHNIIVTYTWILFLLD